MYTHVQLTCYLSCLSIKSYFFCVDLFPRTRPYMTVAIILCDYPCGKDILDIVYSVTVTDSTNRSSHNNAGLAAIG